MSKILACLGLFIAITAQANQGVRSEVLNPFNSTNAIPQDATNLTVEHVKYIQVATKRTYDYTTCVSSEDPGSPDCPTVTDSASIPAIEIEYSYYSKSTEDNQDDGSPYGMDTFVLDPSTLTSSQLAEIPSKGTLKGQAAAAVTSLTSAFTQDTVQVIDDAKSIWCATYSNNDGPDTQIDPNCVDQIAYKSEQQTVRLATGSLK